MNSKQAFKNAVFSLLLQLTLALSGLILPRFFIALYGSAVNGLVSSITQFITYMSLVEAGVGAAGTVALYKPLFKNDTDGVNGILAATKKFYLKSGMLFLGLVILLVIFYPLAVKNEITDLSFIRIMILVLCINGLVDYFFLGKYRVLLMADQRGYILYGVQIIGTIIMTGVCIWQINMEYSALAVKATSAIIYILRSLAVIVYCKFHYPNYHFKAEPNNTALSQRNAALLHQVVGVFANNAAVVLLTLILKKDALVEVSVYSVYNLVSYSLSNMITAITNGITPSFGQMFFHENKDELKDSFRNYEMILFLLIFVSYACVAVLLMPFIGLYSSNFTDNVVYARPILVVLFTVMGLLQAVRNPGLTMICAAGHYKQTQYRAVAELVINLIISIILTPTLGIAGVLIGMICSYGYRTFDVIIYNAKHFMPQTLKSTLLRLLRNTLTIAVVIGIGLWCVPQKTDSWLSWLCSAVFVGVLSLIALIIVNIIFEPKEMKKLFASAKSILKRGN